VGGAKYWCDGRIAANRTQGLAFGSERFAMPEQRKSLTSLVRDAGVQRSIRRQDVRLTNRDNSQFALDCVVAHPQMAKTGSRLGAAPNVPRAPNVEPQP
jgi:hypothetical protein